MTGVMPDMRPLSPEAIEARRLPHPTSFLQGDHARPIVQTKARVARAIRAPKKGKKMTEPLFTGLWLFGNKFQCCAALPCIEFEEEVDEEVDPGHNDNVMFGSFIVRVAGGLP